MTPEELTERYNERAAIREYEGGNSRSHAEYLALLDVRKEIAPQRLPGWFIAMARGGSEGING